MTCADHHHDLTFKALDEQNCNVGKNETEYLGVRGAAMPLGAVH